MAIDKTTVKNWFKTGLRPTQAQFWAWIDSIRFNGERVPAGDVEGLQGLLDQKADAGMITSHVNNLGNPHLTTKAQVGLGNVDNTSDADKPISRAQGLEIHNKFVMAARYAEQLVVGLLDDRGNYPLWANMTAYPSTGGSGNGGEIMKGDLWTITVPPNSVTTRIGTRIVTTGDVVRALTDNAGQNENNWVVTENNLGYVPENSANKSNNPADIDSPVLYPAWRGVNNFVANSLTAFKTANFLDFTSSGQTQLNNIAAALNGKPSNTGAGATGDWNVNSRGLQTRYVPSLDTVTDSGVYRADEPANAPWYAATLHMNMLDGFSQMIIDRLGSVMKFRAKAGSGAWSSWKEVLHSGNYTNFVSSRPYKVYTAKIVQIRTEDPVAEIVFENTLPGVIVWQRTADGEYRGTLAGAFTEQKTICFVTLANCQFAASGDKSVQCYRLDNDTIIYKTTIGGQYFDTHELSMEVRVYD